MTAPEIETDLDRAHALMGTSDNLRLRFYELLADTDLFILLDGEPEGDSVRPSLFAVDGASYTLVFDAEERLSAFVGRAAPYAGLPGRALVQMMAGQGIGLALNPQTAPSEMLIAADAVDWLAATLDHAPEQSEARLTGVSRPTSLPEAVLEAMFVASADAVSKRLARVGLRFDLPDVSRPAAAVPMAPGSDPSAPPKLR